MFRHYLESARKTGRFDFIDAYGKVDSFDTPCQRRRFALRKTKAIRDAVAGGHKSERLRDQPFAAARAPMDGTGILLVYFIRNATSVAQRDRPDVPRP